jgi:WD40 repeat protein
MTLLKSGRVLVSGSEDQTLRFWRTDNGHCFRRRTGYASRVFAIGFGSEDTIVCGTGDHKVVKFDLSSDRRQSNSFDGHHDQVFSIAVEPRSNRVASGSDDGEVRVCDLSTGDTVFAERLHTGWIGSVAFSPSGLMLVTGADDRTMVVLDAVHFTLLCRKRTHEGRISAIVFVNDEVVVCSSEDGTIRVLELPNLTQRLSVQVGAGPLYTVGIARGGEIAIAAGVGGRIWRMHLTQDAQPEAIADLSVNAVWSLDISPDGRRAALGTDDGNLAILDIASGTISIIPKAHQRQIWSVRWAPSGKAVASAGEDGQVALWEIDGKLITRLAPPLLYEGLHIAGSEGLSPIERRHLLSMGALQ